MKLLAILLTLSTSLAQAQVFIQPNKNIKSYSATIRAFPAGTNPTDLCILYGSATKTIKVTDVEVSTNQSTTGTNEIHLIKRTTANSGGGTLVMSTAAWDTGIPAPTAIGYGYQANPTLGTSAGDLMIKRMLSPVSTALGIPYANFINSDFSPIVLRGVSEGLAVNFNAMALPSGLTVNCTYKFTEE